MTVCIIMLLKHLSWHQGAGKCYGYVPRMKRIMIVHQYIWYMVYTYGQREEVLADEVALTSAGRGTEVHPNGDMMSSVTQVGDVCIHNNIMLCSATSSAVHNII